MDIEYIKSVINSDCRNETGLLDKDKVGEKLHELIRCGAWLPDLGAEAQATLIEARNTLKKSGFKSTFNSAREKDREFDEECSPALKKTIELDILIKVWHGIISAQSTLLNKMQ